MGGLSSKNNINYCRDRDGSGCICDLRTLPRDDWNIAKLIGVSTYAQLLDAGPGLFEPFPDMRSDGNVASSIQPINAVLKNLNQLKPMIGGGWLPREIESPPPPNLISTLLVEGDLSPACLKRLLINAVNGYGPIDPRIESIIHSSRSYRSPELSLGEIVAMFVFYSIVVSVVISIVLHFMKKI